MGQHIIITVYFTGDYYRDILKEFGPYDEVLEREYAPYQKEMERCHSEAMEAISLYEYITNDDTCLQEDEYHSQCIITLPKKADLDAGLLALVYHLFERRDIVGFSVEYTG